MSKTNSLQIARDPLDHDLVITTRLLKSRTMPAPLGRSSTPKMESTSPLQPDSTESSPVLSPSMGTTPILNLTVPGSSRFTYSEALDIYEQLEIQEAMDLIETEAMEDEEKEVEDSPMLSKLKMELASMDPLAPSSPESRRSMKGRSMARDSQGSRMSASSRFSVGSQRRISNLYMPKKFFNNDDAPEMPALPFMDIVSSPLEESRPSLDSIALSDLSSDQMVENEEGTLLLLDTSAIETKYDDEIDDLLLQEFPLIRTTDLLCVTYIATQVPFEEPAIILKEEPEETFEKTILTPVVPKPKKKPGFLRQPHSSPDLTPEASPRLRPHSPGRHVNLYDAAKDPHVHRRSDLFLECLEHERSYVASLRRLCELYLYPMRAAAQSSSSSYRKSMMETMTSVLKRPKVLAPKDVDAIYSNIEEILAKHKRILRAIEAHGDGWKATSGLSNVFQLINTTLKIYLAYVRSHVNALATLEQLNRESVAFRKLLATCTTASKSGVPVDIRQSVRASRVLEPAISSVLKGPDSPSMQPSQLGARKSLGFEDLAKAAIKSGGERKDLLQHLGLPLQRIAHLYLFQDRWLKALPNTHPDYVLMTRSFNEFKLHSLPVMQAINEVHNRLRILELRHALPDLPKKIGAPGCRLLHLGLLYQFGTVHASVTTPTIRDKDSKDIPPPTVFAVTSESGTTTKIGVLGSAPDLFNEELEPDSDDDTNSVKQSAIKEVQTWRPDVKQLRLCILFDDCFVWARERKNGWQYINCIPLKSAFMTVLPRTIDRPHAFTLSGSKRSLDLVCSGHGYSGAGDGKNSIITDGETERREWMMRIGDAIKYSNSA